MAYRRIPDETIAEVKAKSDIVTVVEAYVQLSKKSSKNYFGLCPFHSEDTPSFSVSPGKQIYYCFGCHKGGDVINFIREIEGLSYPDAIKFLADRVGIALTLEDDPAATARQNRRKSILAVNVEAARYYYRLFISPEGEAARRYFSDRGITQETCTTFGLGYADDSWDGLYQHLLGHDFDADLLMESGLFRTNRYGKPIDLFHERVIFPIISGYGKGHVIAFGGRILGTGIPKYINSPETPVYTKGEHLYALNLARKSGDKRLLLVEGYMDCIALHQAGIDNAAASLGTALTIGQARLLRQYTEQVIVSFDADPAGQTAMLRSLDVLEEAGLKVTCLQLPDGQDPDDYIRTHSADSFRDLMDQALPLLDFRLLMAERAAQEDGQKDIMRLQDEVCSVLETIDNSIIFEVYLKKAATMLGTTVTSVRQELERRRQLRSAQPARPQYRQAKAATPIPDTEPEAAEAGQTSDIHMTQEEARLLLVLTQDADIYSQLPDENIPEAFMAWSDREGREWLETVFGHIRAKGLSTSELLDVSQEMSLRGVPLENVFSRLAMTLPEQTLPELVADATIRWQRVREEHLVRKRNRLIQEMNQAGQTADQARQTELRSQYQSVEQQLLKLRRARPT